MKTKKVTQHDGWEIKDRTYLLMNNQSPLTYRIPSKHTARQPLLWYDELKNEQREIRSVSYTHLTLPTNREV